MFEDEKNKAELEKLQLELKSLKRQDHWFNKLSTKVVPIFTTLAGILLSYVSFFLPFQLQSKNQENQIFMELIKQATTASTPEGRIAGIWMLNSYWDKEDSNTHKLIANALSGIIMSDPYPIVRMAASEVIGDAYSEFDFKETDKTTQERLQTLRETLYGNGHTGIYGAVTYANWWLAKECGVNVKNQLDKIDPDKNKKVLTKEEQELCEFGLIATREAIRKNWENLENVNLGETDVRSARLYSANLQNASLNSSNLEGATLKDSDLRRANLTNTNLKDTNLQGIKLEGAIFDKNTIFPNNFDPLKHKMYCSCSGANLEGANLDKFPLNGANLSNTNLKNANLQGTNLERANLSNSTLYGADFTGANLTGANLQNAKYDSTTKWPNNFSPPS